MLFRSILLFALGLSLSQCKKEETATPQVFTADANIQAQIDAFKNLLGPDNGGNPGTQGSNGFREVNWDGLSDTESAPNLYEPDLFNSPTAPRSKGLVISTPGSGLMVSADSDNPTLTPVSFGNLNSGYAQIFTPFSASRLFSPVGSNVVELSFYVPGSSTKAAVKGFGAVCIDVDQAEKTSFEFLDINGNSLGTYYAPAKNNGPVFLGVVFAEASVHKVRVTLGNAALGPAETASIDVAVMDNFIFGEPQL